MDMQKIITVIKPKVVSISSMIFLVQHSLKNTSTCRKLVSISMV